MIHLLSQGGAPLRLRISNPKARLAVHDRREDSKAFTKPHTFTRTYTLLPNWEIHEYVCNEFNVDAEHLVGK
jgi:hypothetical protein